MSVERLLAKIDVLLAAKGLSDRKACLKAAEINSAVGVDFIRDMRRRGHPPRSDKLAALAQVLEVSPASLVDVLEGQKTSLEPVSDFNQVPVIGYVQAGIFQHGFSQDYPAEFVSVSPDHRYPSLPRVAFRVRGDSMDLLYPEGTIVLAVRISDLARAPKTGEKVVVIRQTNGDQEATIKQIEIKEDGKVVLWPRSSNPEFSAAIVLPSMADLVEMPDNGCRPEYWIEGVIIQSIRPE